jgi:hypothetical protein
MVQVVIKQLITVGKVYQNLSQQVPTHLIPVSRQLQSPPVTCPKPEVSWECSVSTGKEEAGTVPLHLRFMCGFGCFSQWQMSVAVNMQFFLRQRVTLAFDPHMHTFRFLSVHLVKL